MCSAFKMHILTEGFLLCTVSTLHTKKCLQIWKVIENCNHFLSTLHLRLSVQLWTVAPTEILQQFTVAGCINDGQEEECRTLIYGFVAWSGRGHLLLNVKNLSNTDGLEKEEDNYRPVIILGWDVDVLKYRTTLITGWIGGGGGGGGQSTGKKWTSRLCFLRNWGPSVCSAKWWRWRSVVVGCGWQHQGEWH